MAVWVTTDEAVEYLQMLDIDLESWQAGSTYPLMETIIAQKQRQFQIETGRSIEEVTRTDRLDGHGSDMLVAVDYPIKADSVTLNIYGISPITYAEADLDIDYEAGIIYLESVTKANADLVFPVGRRNLELTATYGWVTIPDDVKDAITKWTVLDVLSIENKRASGADINPSLAGFKIGNYSETYGKNGLYSKVIGSFEEAIQSIIKSYYKTAGVRL